MIVRDPNKQSTSFGHYRVPYAVAYMMLWKDAYCIKVL